MDKIAESLPEDARAVYEEMSSFDFTKAFANMKVAEVKELRGHKMQPSFPAVTVEHAFDKWLPREGDVFIASFPRTGTNWTTEVVHQIVYGRNPDLLKIARSIPLPLCLFEGGLPNKFILADHLPLPRRLVATHLPATLINVDAYTKAKAKFIHVIRNPKDQTVSWYNFSKKLPYLHLEPSRGLFQCDWPEFFENYTQGKQPIGLRDGEWYPDHLLSWYEHRNNENVLILHFEDMKKNLPAEVKKIAEFLGVELNQSEVDKIAADCGFKEMLKAETNANEFAKIRRDIGVLNKGEIGRWKTQFTVAQSELMDSLIQKKLGNTDIKFCYEV